MIFSKLKWVTKDNIYRRSKYERVSKFYAPGLVDVKALLAGNDVLLFSGDVGVAIDEINKAIKEGKITQVDIDERCKKILKAKYWCGLNIKQEIITRNLTKRIKYKTK